MLGNTSGWLHRDGFTLRLERRAWHGAKGSPDGHPSNRGRPRSRVASCAPGSPGSVHVRSKRVNRWRVEHTLLGADPEGWQTHVPAFASVRMRDVNPGIDVQYRPLSDGVVGPFEYDLLLAPGADLAAFSARCEGARSLRIDGAGQLRVLVATPDGEIELVQQAPVAWQDGPRGRQPLHVAFRLLGEDGYGFVAAATRSDVCGDGRSRGGVEHLPRRWFQRQHQRLRAPAARVLGIWVAGWAGSMDFPTTPGAYRTAGQQDGFVARLDENGSTLVYGTYLGGGLGDEILWHRPCPGAAADGGWFHAVLRLPVDAGCEPGVLRGWQRCGGCGGDAFVACFSAAGDSLLGATYLGGIFDDVAEAVAVDAAGYACVAGWTSSGNFPTTPGSWQPALGGPLTLQTDGFLARISPDCRTAAYSTYVGGQLPDQLTALALDRSTGEVIATGWTSSSNFPVTGSAYRTTSGGGIDMVIVRLNATGSNAVFSTYLGSADTDITNCVAVAADGSVWGGGYTNSANFPTSIGAPQRVAGGDDDGVVFHLSANGSTLLFSTLFGGPGAEQVRGVAVDGSDVMAVGETSGGIPVTSQAFQPLFITRYTSSGAVLDPGTASGNRTRR